MEENKLKSVIEGISPERQELLDEMHDWYAFPPVIWAMFNSTRGSDLDFISSKLEEKEFSSRYFVNISYDTLKSHLDALNILSGKRFTNVYMSIMKIRKGCIPILSYDLIARKNSNEYKNYDQNFVNYADITEEHGAFPLYFDIDAKDISDATMTAKKILSQLDYFRCPHTLKFSGSRGFHVCIPRTYMPPISVEETAELIQKVLTKFAIIHDIKDFLDVRTSSRIKGLIKVPYSFDSSSGKGLIALPLSNYDLDNFSLEKVSYKYVRKNIVIKNRGELLEDYGLSIETLRKNVLKFIEQYK